MKEKILEKVELLLSNHIQYPDNFENQLFSIYSTNVLSNLKDILTKADVLNALQKYLLKNWDLVYSTILCYTARPECEITLLLCEIAEYIASEKKMKAIEVLMPNVCIEGLIKDEDNLLKKEELKNIIKKTICGDVKSILTFSKLTSDDLNFIKSNIKEIDINKSEFSILEFEEIYNLLYKNSLIAVDDKNKLKEIIEKLKNAQPILNNFDTKIFDQEKFEEEIMNPKQLDCIKLNSEDLYNKIRFSNICASIKQEALYLIPVSVIEQIKIEEQKIKINNQYFNYSSATHESHEYLNAYEIERLARFSQHTQAVFDLHKSYHNAKNSNLLDYINEFISKAKFSSTLFEGTEQSAGNSVYFAVCEFFSYYKMLSLDQKKIIPLEVTSELGKIFYFSNPEIKELIPVIKKNLNENKITKDQLENPDEFQNISNLDYHSFVYLIKALLEQAPLEPIESCMATRSENLIIVKAKYEEELKKIALVENLDDIKGKIKTDFDNALDNLKNDLPGSDKLGINKKLLEDLKFDPMFTSYEDVQILTKMNTKDIEEILKYKDTRNKIFHAIKNIENLVLFALNMMPQTMKAFLLGMKDLIIDKHIIQGIYALCDILVLFKDPEKRSVFIEIFADNYIKSLSDYTEITLVLTQEERLALFASLVEKKLPRFLTSNNIDDAFRHNSIFFNTEEQNKLLKSVLKNIPFIITDVDCFYNISKYCKEDDFQILCKEVDFKKIFSKCDDFIKLFDKYKNAEKKQEIFFSLFKERLLSLVNSQFDLASLLSRLPELYKNQLIKLIYSKCTEDNDILKFYIQLFEREKVSDFDKEMFYSEVSHLLPRLIIEDIGYFDKLDNLTQTKFEEICQNSDMIRKFLTTKDINNLSINLSPEKLAYFWQQESVFETIKTIKIESPSDLNALSKLQFETTKKCELFDYLLDQNHVIVDINDFEQIIMMLTALKVKNNENYQRKFYEKLNINNVVNTFHQYKDLVQILAPNLKNEAYTVLDPDKKRTFIKSNFINMLFLLPKEFEESQIEDLVKIYLAEGELEELNQIIINCESTNKSRKYKMQGYDQKKLDVVKKAVNELLEENVVKMSANQHSFMI